MVLLLVRTISSSLRYCQKKQGLLYATTAAFWHGLESLCWFLVARPLCFSYFPGLWARNDTSLMS